MVFCWNWSCSSLLRRLDQQKLVVLLWVSRSGNISSSRECVSFENQILLSSSCEHSVIEGLRFTNHISNSWLIFPKKPCTCHTFKTYYMCFHFPASRTKCDSSKEQLVLTMFRTFSIAVEFPVIYAAETHLNFYILTCNNKETNTKYFLFKKSESEV